MGVNFNFTMKLLLFLAFAYKSSAQIKCLQCTTAWYKGEIILSEDDSDCINGECAWLGEDCFLGNSTYDHTVYGMGCGYLKLQLWEGDELVGYGFNRDYYDKDTSDDLINNGITYVETIQKSVYCSGKSCPTFEDALAPLGTKPKCAEYSPDNPKYTYDRKKFLAQKTEELQERVSRALSKHRTTDETSYDYREPVMCHQCTIDSFQREDCDAVVPTKCPDWADTCEALYTQDILERSSDNAISICAFEMGCGSTRYDDDGVTYQYMFDPELCYEDRCNNEPWTPYDPDTSSGQMIITLSNLFTVYLSLNFI